ncbi:hypothetical protein OE88DRAFT_1721668 [Heliocybe sulcata]|uniref:Uncharacterized protein n=1 Tax=Heliocybe sulcata TaxID=5364 RepID=A0A5C3NGF9_9AGAM|nr:hypothetical protein OE88DRAFT_1721668 [Heliocybe sulcata]
MLQRIEHNSLRKQRQVPRTNFKVMCEPPALHVLLERNEDKRDRSPSIKTSSNPFPPCFGTNQPGKRHSPFSQKMVRYISGGNGASGKRQFQDTVRTAVLSWIRKIGVCTIQYPDSVNRKAIMQAIAGEVESYKRSKLAWLFSLITRSRTQAAKRAISRNSVQVPVLLDDDEPSFESPTPPESPVPTTDSERSSTDTSDSSSEVDSPTDSALPSYAEAAFPSSERTYTFTRCSPFAMVMSSESQEDSQFAYHISVGVDVWMPSAIWTSVRRGGEEGAVVAQLELGISAETAVVTFGEMRVPLKHLMTRKTLSSKSRLYHLNDGTMIKWAIQKHPWQAAVGSTTLATFDASVPSRKLTVYPAGFPLFDHLLIGLLILMREHLTPRTDLIGGAAGLFNYHPHAEPNDPM